MHRSQRSKWIPAAVFSGCRVCLVAAIRSFDGQISRPVFRIGVDDPAVLDHAEHRNLRVDGLVLSLGKRLAVGRDDAFDGLGQVFQCFANLDAVRGACLLDGRCQDKHRVVGLSGG